MKLRANNSYRLVQYVALGALEGAIAGWVILILLKWMNVAGIGHLIDKTSDGTLALLMLAVFFGVTYGMIGIAWRVMVLLPDEETEGDVQ